MSTGTLPAADPLHVRLAPTHPDPYPFYGRLARERPFFRDDVLGCWVAASASAVREVLANPICHTRPAHDRIPAALQDGSMAILFGRLVRLRDGLAHDTMKRAILAALRGLDFSQVTEIARARATELDTELGLRLDETTVTRFMFALPVQVIARLLGIAAERYSDVMAWLGDYGVAVAAAVTGVPASNPEMIQRGHAGAHALLALVRALLQDQGTSGPLLAALAQEARRAEVADDEDVVANAVGLMVQGFGAVASVIGLTLLALARRPQLRARIANDRAALRELIQEVIRFDPSTNSTLRFMAEDGVIAGHALHAGEMIIPLIAAANRDPALNTTPDKFDIDRPDRKSLEFGVGAHACPADKLAPLLVEITVEHLLARGAPLERLETAVSYAASAHIRTPRFTTPQGV